MSRLAGSGGHIPCLEPDLRLFASLRNNCARLVPLKSDAEIGPGVEDALDDIKFFLRFQ